MRHRLQLAEYAILGAFALFLILIVLFSFEGQYAGRAITGTTVNITPSPPANCTFTLAQGYNLVSLPCITTADDVKNITSGMPIAAMYQYIPTGDDRWKVYNPNLPPYVVSDLGYMTRRAGYVVIASGDANKTIEGRRIGSTSLPLVPGWNLVGYPRFNESDTATITSSINTSYTIIVGYNTTSGQFESYTPAAGGDLVILQPGKGYWVNATQAASWTVFS